MNNLNEFIKTKSELLTFAMTISLSFFLLFYLFDFEMRAYIIALQIIVFLLVIYLVIAFFDYKKKEDLKDKIEVLNKKIRDLESEMIAKDESIKDYFIMWTHQIKTPITVSKLLLENSSLETEENRDKELKKQLLYISQYTDMALSYLKLMDFDKDMDIGEVNLDLVIKELLKKYSFLFIGNNISLIYDSKPSLVVTDRKWISMLIEQLLSNALKYTNNGSIKISFEHNNFIIQDTGIGIRHEDINKIFYRGYSGFNGRTDEKSSGLGLYLVKRISEKLNLKIKVESKVGEGSVFIVNFK